MLFTREYGFKLLSVNDITSLISFKNYLFSLFYNDYISLLRPFYWLFLWWCCFCFTILFKVNWMFSGSTSY